MLVINEANDIFQHCVQGRFGRPRQSDSAKLLLVVIPGCGALQLADFDIGEGADEELRRRLWRGYRHRELSSGCVVQLGLQLVRI